MKLQQLKEMEPQHCSDPNCDGEITYDETNRDYECMKCGKSADLNEMRSDADLNAVYGGGHEHGQDEESMWDYVEEQVLSGQAEKDPQAFIASLHAMIEKRGESQM